MPSIVLTPPNVLPKLSSLSPSTALVPAAYTNNLILVAEFEDESKKLLFSIVTNKLFFNSTY